MKPLHHVSDMKHHVRIDYELFLAVENAVVIFVCTKTYTLTPIPMTFSFYSKPFRREKRLELTAIIRRVFTNKETKSPQSRSSNA